MKKKSPDIQKRFAHSGTNVMRGEKYCYKLTRMYVTDTKAHAIFPCSQRVARAWG